MSDASPNDEGPDDNPYAARADLLDNVLPVSAPSLGMRMAGFAAGLAAAFTGFVSCWALVSIITPAFFSAQTPRLTFQTGLGMATVVAAMAGYLVGNRVNRRLVDRFNRVREVTQRRMEVASSVTRRQDQLSEQRTRSTADPGDSSTDA